jgi:hypothetical protein
MTTVAIKDGVMAADRLGDLGGLHMPTEKIHRTECFVLGGAGSHSQVVAYLRRIKEMEFGSILELGYPDYDEEKNCPGMIIAPRGNGQLAHYMGAGVWHPIGRSFHAIGSGRDFAIAAMHLGKGAAEAVEVARTFDVYTGGVIDCVEI